MALLDVSDILTDPDFMSAGLLCERNAQSVGSDGLAALATTTIPFSAVVTSKNGDILKRQAQGERVEGSMTLHTRFMLMDGNSGNTADIVTWQGRRYTVSMVNDWSQYGRGFYQADCDLIPLQG